VSSVSLFDQKSKPKLWMAATAAKLTRSSSMYFFFILPSSFFQTKAWVWQMMALLVTRQNHYVPPE
jgi:hypothetical protein